MTKNLRDHFQVKCTSWNQPGLDYYQLLQSAKKKCSNDTRIDKSFCTNIFREKLSEDNNVSENKDLRSKSNSRKQLEYDHIDHTTASPTKKADIQFTEDAALIGEITNLLWWYYQYSEWKWKCHRKNVVKWRACNYKDHDDRKWLCTSSYKNKTLFHCSSAVGKKSWYNGCYKGRKPRSMENVVGDVRQILKIVAVNVTALF